MKSPLKGPSREIKKINISKILAPWTWKMCWKFIWAPLALQIHLLKCFAHAIHPSKNVTISTLRFSKSVTFPNCSLQIMSLFPDRGPQKTSLFPDRGTQKMSQFPKLMKTVLGNGNSDVFWVPQCGNSDIFWVPWSGNSDTFWEPQCGNSDVFWGVYSMSKTPKEMDLKGKGASDQFCNTFSMFRKPTSSIY